ncbi:carbonic anhydrase [Paenibacillus ihuae]|uniref:carbonic anhydrase n=1 Tax=Paenibacillus ihuae TaxID=1232431 RepID=UPI0006D54B9E|nr:carbonic anhydrase family protein [Paenibacillus ihuae]
MRINKWIPRILFPVMVMSVIAGCGNNAPNNEAEGTNAPSPAAGAHQAHWSYEGDTSPEHWAELDQLFTTCSTGTAQSPVNILHDQVKDDESLSPIKLEYSPSPVAIINNGHTIQVNLKNQDNRLVIEGKTYTLQQFHFHLPSEHEMDGKHAEMELHLVHKSEDGSLAVLGVLIHSGSENTGLNQLWSLLPAEESEEETLVAGDFNLNGLLPADLHSFRYQGSLTTPPCTEGVQWIVLENPVQWSGEQIGKFAAIFPHDNRPVQTLGNREIDSDE